jgi:hypothetical protein
MSAITIDLNELRTLLARVIPFAADHKLYSGALPVIESVQLQVRGDQLIASATDRYVLGMARTSIEGDKDFEALLKILDVKHILTIFKSRKGIATKVTLTRTGGLSDGTLAVALADGLFAGADDLTAKYGLIDGTFPKVHEIFTKWEAPTEATATGYNPAYLARFAHVTTHNLPIKLSGGGDRATIVQAGDYFLGAIMPVRITDMKFSEMNDWTAMFAPPKPKAAPAKKAATTKVAAKKAAPVRKRAAAKVA